eukprot:CAMPEP_0178426338 /NCGR_PEP_ID=MMETSP0689_2-20121128/29184_1 /TAXON_ID=160604 /ORGANISM="Amphidinium massartii, Strain CS-259" /LENGTH=59 /DNA_ID=CAMNT_0020048023 /DNA_START=286 /DNA_END=465 /DNA_ORIENTATION=-
MLARSGIESLGIVSVCAGIHILALQLINSAAQPLVLGSVILQLLHKSIIEASQGLVVRS